MFNAKPEKLIVLLAAIFFAASYAVAANIGNSIGHAWAEKFGYISFEDQYSENILSMLTFEQGFTIIIL